MPLTKAQKRNLELYATYRATPPTFWLLFRQNLLRYAGITALVILLFLLAPTAGTQSLVLVLAGLFLGALARDIGRFRQFVRTWPATAAVLNWQKLDSLLANSDSTTQEMHVE
jgi:hypothetical protein